MIGSTSLPAKRFDSFLFYDELSSKNIKIIENGYNLKGFYIFKGIDKNHNLHLEKCCSYL